MGNKAPMPFVGKLEKQATIYLRANKNRFESYRAVEDLVQDAYLLYANLVERYPHYDERRFTATFMRSLDNWAKLAKRPGRRNRQVTVTKLQGSAEPAADFLDNVGGFGTFSEYELLKEIDATTEERAALEIIEAANYEVKRRKLNNTDDYESGARTIEKMTGYRFTEKRLRALLQG